MQEFEQKWKENRPLNPRHKNQPIRMRRSASHGPPEHAIDLEQRQGMDRSHQSPPISHSEKAEVGWWPGWFERMMHLSLFVGNPLLPSLPLV
jgi:hypothetical protein